MERLLADAILAIHLLIVLANIVPVPLIIVGGWRGWAFVRARWFRFGHLAMMLFIALQSWAGQLCPLTIWERDLRAKAGQLGYGEQSFVSYWMEKLLYVQMPGWAFVVMYTGWCLLITALFYFVPLRRRNAQKNRAPVSIQG